MTVSRSPSSGTSAPVVSLIVRIGLRSEAFDGAGLVGVYLDEVLRPGHRQHRLDALLDAGQLQRAAGGRWSAGRDPSGSRWWRCRRSRPTTGRRSPSARPAAMQLRHRGREFGEQRIHQPRLADADDGDAAGVFGGEIHSAAPDSRLRRARLRGVGCLSSQPLQLTRQLEPAAVDARLHGAFRQPSRSAISWYDNSCRSRSTTAVRSVAGSLPAPAAAAPADPGARPPHTAPARVDAGCRSSCRHRARSSAAPSARCGSDRCRDCG